MAITSLDKQITFSRWVKYSYKLLLLDDNDIVVDEIESVESFGNVSVDGTSSRRRSYSFTMHVTNKNMSASERSRMWMNKRVRFQLGIITPRLDDYKYYNLGMFVITDTSSQFSSEDNSISVNCNDYFSMLDGTQNGSLNAITTTIPAYEENKDGTVKKYNIIRNALISTITQLGGIKNYMIDDIGEANGMAEFNDDYLDYREKHPTWNVVPYDLEYSAGDTVSSIIDALTNLYPNYDSAFNEDGLFVTRLIPSCYDDPISITNEDIQNFFVSESTSLDYSSVRNVVHVWGQAFDVEHFSETVTNNNSVYSTSIESYGNKYVSGDLIAIKVPTTNSSTQYININNIGNVQIYDEYKDTPLAASTLIAGQIYVFKCRPIYNGETVKRFYLQGQWQAHGLIALVDGSESKEQYKCSDGTVTTLYTKKYFQDKYGVDNVRIKVIKDSPFTVQKLGERVDIKSGDEYDNITSDSLAIQRAEYELYVDARLTDNITVEINRLVPWLKEYMKVSYIKQNDTEEKQYITDQISLNLDEGTTSMTMHTFYPLYDFLEKRRTK